MTIFQKYFVIFAVYSILLVNSQKVCAWTKPMDFNSGQIGTKVTEFTDAATQTFYSDAKVFEGSGVAELNIKEGDQGFGRWGGRLTFNAANLRNLGQGDEIYFRVSTYFPEDFDYTASPRLKFLRIHVADKNGKNRGYSSIYISPGGSYYQVNEVVTTRRLLVSNEEGEFQEGETVKGLSSGATTVLTSVRKDVKIDWNKNYKGTGLIYKFGTSSGWIKGETIVGLGSGAKAKLFADENNSKYLFGQNNQVTKGKWETVIYNVKFNTGKGSRFRFWKEVDGNMKLLYDDKTDFSLASSSDVVDAALLFTYWNGNSPKTQKMYVDNIYISTEPPPELTSSSSGGAPPNPPLGLQ